MDTQGSSQGSTKPSQSNNGQRKPCSVCISTKHDRDTCKHRSTVHCNRCEKDGHFPAAGLPVQGQVWFGWKGQRQSMERQGQGQGRRQRKHRPGEAVGRLLQRRNAVTISAAIGTGGSHPHHGSLLAGSDTW